MSPTRLLVVSDSHLSPRTPDAEANWSAVVAHVAEKGTDLVVHLGDLSLDGAHGVGDLQYGRAQLDRLPVPWLAVPGNHDIGDNPSPTTPQDAVVDTVGLQRWLDLIGSDRWSAGIDGWCLVAVNAQLFGSGLPAEDEQWTWLHAVLQERPAEQPVVFITHKPLAATDKELAGSPPYRFIPSEARRRLAELLTEVPLGLVLSGHVHQYRLLHHTGVPHVWAPTTWAVLPDGSQPRLGLKRCGALALELASPGLRYGLVEPVGMRQLTIGQDTPDPYTHRESQQPPRPAG